MMNTQSLFEQRRQFLFAPSATVRGGLLFCMIAGIFAFVGGMYAGEATRTWGALIFNLFFFFSLALGGVVFSGMQDVISAKWGRPMMRLHESFASFLPVAAVAFLVFFICIGLNLGHAKDVYPWIRDPELVAEFWGKRTWLQPGLMMGRDIFALFSIYGLSLWQLGNKTKPDLLLMSGDQAGASKQGQLSQARLRYWSAPVLIAYALLFTLLAFDITASLAPLWYSTLWGGWSFAVMMQSLMAALLLFMYAVKGTPIGQFMRRQQFHDIGKFMHGFTVFFAYLTYAHIITIWYGNMPEETSFFIARLQGPWLLLLYAVFFLAFILPLFALLPKISKWTSGLAIPICASILLAQWIVNLLIVMPQVTDGSTWMVPWIEVGIFLGILGLFIGSIFRFGRKFPMVSIADPLLHEALADAAHH